jgi:hypothetical protein
MNEIVLAPCPHCGSGARLVNLQNGYAIVCDDKNCLGLMKVSFGSCDNKDIFLQKLVSDWNRRVPEIKAVASAIQSVREYRDHIYEESQEEYDVHCAHCVDVLDEAINILQCFTAFNYTNVE